MLKRPQIVAFAFDPMVQDYEWILRIIVILLHWLFDFFTHRIVKYELVDINISILHSIQIFVVCQELDHALISFHYLLLFVKKSRQFILHRLE